MKPDVTQAFNTDNLSIFDRWRLESLLSHVERTVDERRQNKRQIYSPYLSALNEWLEHPNESFEDDFKYLYEAIPDDRVSGFIDEEEQDYSTIKGSAQSFARLRSHPVYKQKHAIAFTSIYSKYFDDNDAEEQHWTKLAKLYDSILSAFPNILYCKDDIQGHRNVLHLWGQRKRRVALKKLWQDRSVGHRESKINVLKDFMAIAYPKDNVRHMQIDVKPLSKIGGAVVDSLKADTMIHNLGDLNNINRTLFVFLHELQHRRQKQKIERLHSEEIPKGTAEYYQARLFDANLFEGYLNYATTVCQSGNVMSDYRRQPVEQHANSLAALPRFY